MRKTRPHSIDPAHIGVVMFYLIRMFSHWSFGIAGQEKKNQNFKRLSCWCICIDFESIFYWQIYFSLRWCIEPAKREIEWSIQLNKFWREWRQSYRFNQRQRILDFLQLLVQVFPSIVSNFRMAANPNGWSCSKMNENKQSKKTVCVKSRSTKLTWSFDNWAESCDNYQVCARGKDSTVPHFSIVNICGPFEPYNSLKPFIGTRDVPVTNWSKRERISFENDNTARQNHWIIMWFA